MKAMLLEACGAMADTPEPLVHRDLPMPVPGPGELLVKVEVCGVCHTELDEIEGRTPPPRLPVIPGHQVVGTVVEAGPGCEGRLTTGTRVGIAWIFRACGTCPFCRSGRENLCPAFVATGRDVNGGYAEWMTVPEDFAHPLPEGLEASVLAPMLCAGAIGWRSLALSGLRDGQDLGLTGFGASAHLVLPMVRHRFPASRVFVFARSETQRAFALELGASWAGPTEAPSPVKLHAIIDTTPAWTPVVEALKNLHPGGRLVINAISKQEADKAALLGLDYPRDLWREKEIRSVANVTRADVREFLALAAAAGIRPDVREYPARGRQPGPARPAQRPGAGGEGAADRLALRRRPAQAASPRRRSGSPPLRSDRAARAASHLQARSTTSIGRVPNSRAREVSSRLGARRREQVRQRPGDHGGGGGAPAGLGDFRAIPVPQPLPIGAGGTAADQFPVAPGAQTGVQVDHRQPRQAGPR